MTADVFSRVGITRGRETCGTGWHVYLIITISKVVATSGGGGRAESKGLGWDCGSITPTLGKGTVRIELGYVSLIILKLLLDWIIPSMLRLLLLALLQVCIAATTHSCL